MKKNKNAVVQDEKKINNFFLFPEKLSTLLLALIIIIAVAISFTVAAFALPKRSYKYYPDSQEALYADKYNMYFKMYSNFSYSNNELSKKDTLVLYFKPINSMLYQPEITKTYITIVTNNNDLLYYTPSTEIKGYISALTQRTIYPNTNISTGAKDIYFRIGYNLKDFTGDSPVVTQGILNFKETLLTLSKSDKDIEFRDDFKTNSNIFKEFYVKVLDTTDSDNVNKRSIRSKITLDNSVINKYHLDIQLFGVKGSDVYQLGGYYNLSCVATPTTEMSVNFPYDYDLDYIYAKAKYIDENGKDNYYLFKQLFSSLKE